MAITRREFLQYSAATGAGVLFGVFDLKPIVAYAQANPPVFGTLTASICCYCAVGCGILVGTKVDDPYVDSSTSEHVTYVQGDPDHPINRGTLCSKGGAMAQLRTVDGALNTRRLTQPLYRAAGASDWTPISWNTALNQIVTKIRATRNNAWDSTLSGDPTVFGSGAHPCTVTLEEIDGEPTPVNRCTGIACLGGAAHDTEECYLLVKLMRALGLVYLEHQARI
jgi:formate dehydrogenase major subunit